MRVPFCTHGAIVKVVAGETQSEAVFGYFYPRTEVRVRSRWPVAIGKALSVYSVNFLILYYVLSECEVELSAAKL